MPHALILALLFSLLAQPLMAAEPPRQVKLTPRLVERFLASYEPVKAFNAKYDAKWGEENFGGSDMDGAKRMRQALEAKGALADFNALVARYGFRGVEEWWPVAHSTMMAYGFGDPAHDAAKATAEIRDRLAGIEKDPALTPAQKADYREALTTLLARYDAMKPPPGNIEVVRPYRDRIKALIGDEP